jgi:hypothetical protein
MVLELAALITAVVAAIFNGVPVLARLWMKLKGLFGSSKLQ